MVVCVNGVECGSNTTFADHMPHGVNLFYIFQIECYIGKLRRLVITTRHGVVVVLIQTGEDSL